MLNLGVLSAVLELKNKMSPELKKATKDMAGAGSGAGKLSAATKALALGGIAAVGAALASAVAKTVEFGTTMADTASKTGINTTKLQELRFAGEQAGVGFDKITDAAVRLGRRSAAELPETVKWLDQVGLTTEDIVDLDPGAAFELVAAKIAEIPEPARQSAAAMGIFGDAGLSVLPAINQGLDENIARFRELGITMSEEDVAAAKAFGDSITDLNAVWERVSTTVGSMVIPWLTNLITFFSDILPGAIQFAMAAMLDFFSGFLGQFERVSGFLADFVPGMGAINTAIGNARATLDGMSTALDDMAAKNFVAATATKETAEALGGEGGGGGVSGAASEATAKVAEYANSLTIAGEQSAAMEDAQKLEQALLLIGENAPLTVEGMALVNEQFERLVAAGFSEAMIPETIAAIQTNAIEARAAVVAFANVTAGQMTESSLAAVEILSMEDAALLAHQGMLASAEAAARRLGVTTRTESNATLVQMQSDLALITAAYGKHSAEVGAAEEALAQFIKDSRDDTAAEGLSTQETFSKAAGALFSQFGGAYQIFAASEAFISALAASAKTMATTPFPANIGLAAAALAAGMGVVSAIKSAATPGFAAGTPGLDFANFGGGTSATLHGNEAVIPSGSGHKLASEVAGALADKFGVSLPSIPGLTTSGGGDGGAVTIEMPTSVTIEGATGASSDELAAKIVAAQERNLKSNADVRAAVVELAQQAMAGAGNV